MTERRAWWIASALIDLIAGTVVVWFAISSVANAVNLIGP